MSDPRDVIPNPTHPLDGAKFSAGEGPSVLMRPSIDGARLTLRIGSAHLDEAAAAFGQAIPPEIGETSFSPHKTALCLGPDEWLLLAPESERDAIATRFATLAEKTVHSLVDVGHRTIGLDISGPAAALVLTAGCPLDLDNFPVGRCTRTIFDKAEIILFRTGGEQYHLEIIRSFAEYVWNFLASAGRELDAATAD